MKYQLSISILVSNHIDTIRKCLESIKPLPTELCAELIVVDTGSSDGSIDIAKEYTDIIIPFTWCNDFSAARNVGLNAARGEWFMFHYLNHLTVPEGYEIDLLTIQDAASITEGYLSGQQASDAKYKIYMHQDVFILNKNLLQDLLDIFRDDPQIGLIGMVGYENISPDGIMWHGTQRGNIYRHKPDAPYPSLSEYRYRLENDGYSYVAEVDGLFMATSVDLPWDTETLKDWDFYDAFQSVNYLLAGMKIAVPNQTHPWCLHDDGVALKMLNYNKYRQLVMQKYQSLLGKHYSDF